MAKKTLAQAENEIKSLKALNRKTEKSFDELKSDHVLQSKKIKELEKQIGKLQSGFQPLLDAEKAKLKPIQEENIELKKQLTEAIENPKLKPEQLEEIEANVVKRFNEALAEAQAEEEEKQIIPTFTPAQEIRIKSALFTLVNNPSGHLGAFDEMLKNIHTNLFKAQNIPFHVAEIPEASRKGDQYFLVYKGLVSQQATNIQLKDNNDGQEA